MGRSMVANLARAGIAVTARNRTRERADFVSEARELGLGPRAAEAALGRHVEAAFDALAERDFAAAIEAVGS